MDLRILIAVALIACAQAFELKRLPLIKRPELDGHTLELTSEQQRELVDPYPTNYHSELATKEVKLGNIIEETEPEFEGRVRRSPKEPATGKIVVSGNARKGSSTGGRTEGQIYVGGQIRFRRSADEKPEDVQELVEDEAEEQTRVRRSPKKGKGRVIVRGEAGRTNGRNDAGIHLIGEYRFRRSADETPENVQELVEDETEEQSETRVRRSPKKGNGRVIVRGEAGRTNGRNDAGIHLIGEYRFRRSAEEQPESVVEETQEESEGRVRRSPKEPATGKIVVSGNARKGASTGGRTEGQVYVGGQIRFRRSADETPEDVQELVEDETEEQTRFRRSPKKGRGRVIVRGEAGRTNGRNDAGVHLIGEYRFRRSVEEQPESVVEEHQEESEGRVRRSPKEPATGKIVVSGNARKGSSTGGRTEGQIYVGGQVRFRRSAEEAAEAVEELVEDEAEEQTRVRRSPKKGRGRVIVRGEAGRTNGRNDAGVHLIGEYRFRRSVEEAPKDLKELVHHDTEEQSQTRFRRSPKKGRGRVIVRGEAGRTNGRNDAGVHLIGEYRFRRSVEEAPKDLKELVHHDTEEQSQTRFRRSPKKGRGRVIVRGEAGRTNGRNDAGVHLIGEYRFRRSAEQEQLVHH